MKSVFISSTFKDMQAERDYLHEKIFPKIRKMTSQYGEDIQELDLRWGVDTYNMSEEESGYQVLRVCIDAIDRCKPYIIVLLGERYGWIPDVATVESLQDDRISNQYEENISITNLEIKYGALSEEETLKRCIFCFRDAAFLEEMPEEKRGIYMAESEYHKQKLDILKEQIRSKEHAQIIEYKVKWDEKNQILCGMEALGEAIGAQIEKMLQEDFAGKTIKNPMEQILVDAEYTKERFLSTYIPRLQEEKSGIEALMKMAEGKLHCLHFAGKAGCGKSAFMAAFENSVKEAGAETILYFSGNPGCQSIYTLKNVLIYRLEEILGREHREDVENKNEYLRELGLHMQGRKVFLFVDALDQLFSQEKNAPLEIVGFCPELSVITSSLEDFPYENALMYARNIQTIEIGKFRKQDKQQLIEKTCEYRGKKIDDEIRTMICEKEGSENPLFLSLLLQRLFAMRQEDFQKAEEMAPGIEGLHRYLAGIIRETPQDIYQMGIHLFQWIGKIFQSEFFETVANLIALSENGLTETEIKEILEMQGIPFSQLKFQEILFYLYDVFTENENGKWIFSHRIFYEALKENMGEREETYLRYFIEYSQKNPVFMEKEGFYHILRSKHPLAAYVLANCEKWSTVDVIFRMVTNQAQEEENIYYFTGMVNEENAEPLVRFWKEIGRFEGNQKLEKCKKAVYDAASACESLSAEKKASIIMDMFCFIPFSEYPEYFPKMRKLLPFYKNENQRIKDSFVLEYREIFYYICTDKKEKAHYQRFDKYLSELKAYFEHEELGKDILYRYLFGCYIYANYKRQNLKETAAEYLLEALNLYDIYPEFTCDRRFQLTKIELNLEMSRHSENPEYMKEAMQDARTWADKETSVEILDLYAKILVFYGKIVDKENRYRYRYESFQVVNRIYQMTRTLQWKQSVADKAALFAKDTTMPADSVWKAKREEAWKLCFQYNQELYEAGHTPLWDTYYEKCLIYCVEQDLQAGDKEQAFMHLKMAQEMYKDRKAKGWKSEEIQEWGQVWQILAGLLEILNDRLMVDEALDIVDEMITYARKIGQEFYLFYGLKLAASVYYHGNQDETALKYAVEGLDVLRSFEKKKQMIYPSETFDFCYIIDRVKRKAGQYSAESEKIEEKYLTKEQQGRRCLLHGDRLFKEKDFSGAKGFYENAIVAFHQALEEDPSSRKRFFYYMYAISQKAESMLAGKITDKQGSKNTFIRKLYGQFTAYQEYEYVFTKCLEKLQKNEMVEIARKYMFTSIGRLLEQEVTTGLYSVNQFEYLCQMAEYCSINGIDFSDELKVLVDGLCKYDMNTLMFWIKGNTWLSIFPYIKQAIEEGAEIITNNYHMISWMWFQIGCYKEAAKYAQMVKESDSRYVYSRHIYFLSEAMCAMYHGEEEKLQKILRELNPGGIREHDLSGNISIKDYYELMQSELLFEGKVEKFVYTQEEAQRYLNRVRMWTKKERYDTLDRSSKMKLWQMTFALRNAYLEGNEKLSENWKDVAKKMKELTGDGMLWQVDYEDVDREILTCWGNLYFACEDAEEKKELLKSIFEYWSKYYKSMDVRYLSAENMEVLHDYFCQMKDFDISPSQRSYIRAVFAYVSTDEYVAWYKEEQLKYFAKMISKN